MASYDAQLAERLDVWDLREKDRERFGGIVIPSQITNADRCGSQTCCDGFLGQARVEGWSYEALANDEYRNGLLRLMDAEQVADV